ncbi:hypothetical protein PR003_g27759 [Phytophthora rubi]|uniref:beta-glucosidase n=2 Tax=Phytophthora rubi TaxID=129364 RepID=A0A6A4C523_9STRA|nr:hypothetical protein PR003_g27759 [Phytophthora rubi]
MKAALKDRLASSDAYALIAVAGKKVTWTLEPVWSDTFFFRNVRPDKLYQLDKDLDGDDALDQTQFTVTNTDAAETTFELPTTRKEKEAGAIVLKVNSHAKKVFGDGKLQQYDRGPRRDRARQHVPPLRSQRRRSRHARERPVEESARRVVKLKLQLGVYDNAVASDDQVDQVGNDDDTAAVLNSARESIVLLQNDNSVLPIPETANVFPHEPLGRQRRLPVRRLVAHQCHGRIPGHHQQDGDVTSLTYFNGLDYTGTYNESDLAQAKELASHHRGYRRALIKYVTELASTGTEVIVMLVGGRPRLLGELPNNVRVVINAMLPCELVQPPQPELRGRQGDGPALPHAVFRTISVPEVKQLKKFTEIGLTKVAEDADYMIAIKPETDCDVYSDTAVANPLCANFTLQPGEHPFGSFE